MALTQIQPEAMSRDEFLKAMVTRLDGKRHADYPFLKAVRSGAATREQVGFLGVAFYHFTKVTPQVLSTIHSRCDDRRIRRRIMDTLIDEDTELRCGSKGHDALAMDFATRFTGWSEQEVEDFDRPRWLKDMVDYRFKVARDNCTTRELQQMMLWCIDEYTRHWGNFWRACEKGAIPIKASARSS